MSYLSRQQERWFYVLIAPWLVGLVLFSLGPVLLSLGLSFTQWQPPTSPTWVGSQNFQKLIQDPLAVKTLFNTIVFTSFSSSLSVLLGLGLALLLNRPGVLAGFTGQVVLLPVLISGAAISLVWGWMFNHKFGILNNLLGLVGIKGPNWLGDPNWAMASMVIIQLWGLGAAMAVYLAALRQIPAQLLEAASLEGAGSWAKTRFIVLPLLTPISFYLLVITAIGSFQVFTPTYVLTRGGPDHATLTLPLYIYQNAFMYGNLGYASALAVELLLGVALLTWLQFRLSRYWMFDPKGPG